MYSKVILLLSFTFVICCNGLVSNDTSDVIRQNEDQLIEAIHLSYTKYTDELEDSRASLNKLDANERLKMVAQMKALTSAIDNYTTIADAANKSLSECYIDEISSREVLSTLNEALENCYAVAGFDQIESLVNQTAEYLQEVKGVVPNCVGQLKVTPQELLDCSSEQFQSISKSLESNYKEIDYLFLRSAGASECTTGVNSQRINATALILDEFVACAKTIL